MFTVCTYTSWQQSDFSPAKKANNGVLQKKKKKCCAAAEMRVSLLGPSLFFFIPNRDPSDLYFCPNKILQNNDVFLERADNALPRSFPAALGSRWLAACWSFSLNPSTSSLRCVFISYKGDLQAISPQYIKYSFQGQPRTAVVLPLLRQNSTHPEWRAFLCAPGCANRA